MVTVEQTILLVEDEPLIALAEKMLLEKTGYTVVTAGTGEKAVDLIQNERGIDLVLMDIDLGQGMSGTDAAELILSKREIPVVFLSSHTEPEIVEKTEGITSYGYIVKNSGTTVLLASIRMAFRLFEEKQAVRRHEQLLSGVFDSIQDGISVLDEQLRIQHVNHAMERWYPEPDGITGRKCHEVYHHTDQICSFCPSVKALKSGKVERAIVPGRVDSPVKWLELYAHPMVDPVTNETTGVVEFVRDITVLKQHQEELERKTAAQAELSHENARLHVSLRTSQRKLADAARMARIGHWEYDVVQKVFTFSDSFYHLFRTSAEEQGGYQISQEEYARRFVHPDDAHMVAEEARKAIDATNPDYSVVLEHRVIFGDGSSGVIEVRFSIIKDDQGRTIRTYGVNQDITERVAVRQELADQKQYLKSILETTSDGFLLVAPDRTICDVNLAYRRMTGYTRDELAEMTINDIDVVEDPRETRARIDRIMRNGWEVFETAHRRKDGSVLDVEIGASRLDRVDGVYLVCFCRDITERKQSEESLVDERRRLASIIQGTDVGTWEWNVQTGETIFNERWAEMIGYSLEEISPVSIRTWERFAHPEDLKGSAAMLEKHFRGELPLYEYECRMKHRDGSWVWVLDRGRVVSYDDTGAPLMMMGTHQDITERITREAVRRTLAEEARKLNAWTHSTINYREIADTARELSGAKYAALNRFDENGQTFTTLAFAGSGGGLERAAAILGFSPVGREWEPDERRATMIGAQKTTVFAKLRDLVGDTLSGKIVDILEQTFRLGPVVIVRITRDDRTLGDFTLFFEMNDHLENQGSVELYADMLGLVLTRVETDERNTELVHEKELLLTEVHHRIKNNMNTMTSLLSLQAQATENPEVVTALNDAESRLRSMQVLYDRLYRTDSSTGDSVPEYLKRLVHRVVDIFPAAGEITVSVESRCDASAADLPMTQEQTGHCVLDARRLSTVGLIVNELVTNAMKHAFPADGDSPSSGRLGVTTRCCGEAMEICVEDNGPGLPDSYDPEQSPGFGLTMVRALTEQLKGTIRFERGNAGEPAGTRVVIRFPRNGN